MKTLPSKELLSAVFSAEVESVEESKTFENELTIYFTHYDDSINIYELMHMMKEWAYAHGYCISNEYGEDESSYIITTTLNSFICDGYGESEPEAVTKACEWILWEIIK